MFIPSGHTEASVLAAVDKAAAILAPSFAFGSHNADDVRQQCFVFAAELLAKDRYDASRPLENYVYAHVRNRLINWRRNLYRRADPPCRVCHDGTPCGGEGAQWCERYRAWLGLNQAKANLASPLALDRVSDEWEPGGEAEEQVELEELLDLIDERLPVDLRGSYLQMRAGVSVPKARRLEVERAVIAILGGVVDKCPSEDD
jgi:DNA-directed RNA polymerase specialized sigma24 family protein